MILSPLLYGSSPKLPPKKYVIVCENNIIVTSDDGVVWSQSTVPIDYGTGSTGVFNNIRYSNGYYYALGNARSPSTGGAPNGYPQLLVSTDAINWRTIQLGLDTNFIPLSGDNVFNGFYDSIDLNGFTFLTGDLRTQPSSYKFVIGKTIDTYGFKKLEFDPTVSPNMLIPYRGYVYNNECYLLTNFTPSNSAKLFKTKDFKTFTQMFNTVTGNIVIEDIIYHTGINPTLYMVSTGTSGGIWRYRTDLNVFVRPTLENATRIVNSPTLMIAINPLTKYITSTDGINWFPNTTLRPNAIVYDGSKFIMSVPLDITNTTFRLYTGTDGINWAPVNNVSWNINWKPTAIYASTH